MSGTTTARIAGSLRPLARKALLALGVATFGGCAYFNGVYNARSAQKSAEGHQRAGRESQAFGSYATAAAKAESVLVRFPKSRWRADALYIAGRGHAFSDACPRAVERLQEFLALPGTDENKRIRAEVALGSCHSRQGRPADALQLLEPLTTSRDRDVARLASLWAGRTVLALGDGRRAQAFFAKVGTASADWELAGAALSAGRFAEAETLFMRRAARADFREEVLPALTELWRAGRREGVDSIVARYDRSKTSARAKARIMLAAADLMIASNLDDRARWALERAQRLAVDTLLDREAIGRLTLLSMGNLTSTFDAKNLIDRARPSARGSVVFDRLDKSLLMLTLLEKETDVTGASLFLAAEIARDSMRAPRLSETLFRRVADIPGGSLLSPKALLAISIFHPDSAPAIASRMREQYPRSPWTVLLDGGDPGQLPAWGAAERLLKQRWETAARVVEDSLRVRRGGTVATPPVPARPPSPDS